MTYPPGEMGFKLAACALVLRGRYPSGRAILNELGRTHRTKGKRLQLNGRECNWKHWVFQEFSIEPCINWTRRWRREEIAEWLHGDREFKYRRGPRGSLVLVNPPKPGEWWR
jgi:hypothetical protein